MCFRRSRFNREANAERFLLFNVNFKRSVATIFSLKLSVHLSGSGWADAIVADGGAELSIALSYISDGIGEMAAAAKALLQGAQTARFAFQDEPGEHVFVLTRGPEDSLKIEIFKNQRNFMRNLGAPVMTIHCAILDFVGQVFLSLHSLLLADGDSYKERWRHDFPLDDYRFIQAAI